MLDKDIERFIKTRNNCIRYLEKIESVYQNDYAPIYDSYQKKHSWLPYKMNIHILNNNKIILIHGYSTGECEYINIKLADLNSTEDFDAFMKCVVKSGRQRIYFDSDMRW